MNDLNESVVGSEGSSSLPAIIRMFQYNYKWSLGLVTDKDNNQRVGTTGNQYLEYAFECEHTSDNDNCGFDFIIKRLAGTKFPTFRKEELTNNFHIIKITDFGHQAMSKFYTDFVPEVYFSGKKLFNKYVATLKNFSSKTEFLLIPKNVSTNIKEINETKGVINCANCHVKIVAKTNIEDKIHDYTLEKCVDEGNEYYGYYCKKDIDFNIISKNSIDDFEIYINNSSQKLTLENKLLEKIIIEECDDSGVVISTQTLIDKDNKVDEETVNEYFRQLFEQQYASSQSNLSRPGCKTNIWIKFSSRLSGIVKVILRLKSKDKRSYYGEIPENCNIYRIISNDGTTIFAEPESGLKNCEIIPVYNNIHKLTKKITTTNSVLKTLRKYGYYQGCLKRPQIDIYTPKGDFVKTVFGDTSIEEESIIVVYDNHDVDDIFNPTENISGENDTIGILSNQNVYFGETYTNITSSGTEIDGKTETITLSSVSPSLIGITKNPITPNTDFPEIFAIAKYSFFKYNTYIYDDYIYIFKLPKLPVDSASIAKSFENTVRIKNVKPMRLINSYEIFGSEVFGYKKENNDLNVNTFNIINFNERNPAGSDATYDSFSFSQNKDTTTE